MNVNLRPVGLHPGWGRPASGSCDDRRVGEPVVGIGRIAFLDLVQRRECVGHSQQPNPRGLDVVPQLRGLSVGDGGRLDLQGERSANRSAVLDQVDKTDQSLLADVGAAPVVDGGP